MMDEKTTQDVELTEEELVDVAGGKSRKHNKAEKTKNKCLECMKATHLTHADNNSHIYSAKGSNIKCCKNGHVWENGIYTHFSEADVAKWFKEH